jgi:hypothetical protein
MTYLQVLYQQADEPTRPDPLAPSSGLKWSSVVIVTAV